MADKCPLHTVKIPAGSLAQRAGCVSLRDGEARAGSRPSRNGNRVGHFWLTRTFRLSLWHGRVEKAQELSGLVAAPSVGPGAKSGFRARAAASGSE